MNGQVAGRNVKTEPGEPTKDALKAVTHNESHPIPTIPESSDTLSLDAPSEATVNELQNYQYYKFNLSFSESCNNGTVAARGWWYDGNKRFEIKLTTYTATRMQIHPSAPNKTDTLVLGPYDFDHHSMAFEYGGCKFNSKSGSSCGTCIPQSWTLPPLNCSTHAPGQQRVSEPPPSQRRTLLTGTRSPTQSANSKTQPQLQPPPPSSPKPTSSTPQPQP